MKKIISYLIILLTASTSYANLRGKSPSMNGAVDVYYDSGSKPSNVTWVGDLSDELRDLSETKITVVNGIYRKATDTEISTREQPDYYRILVSPPDTLNSGVWRELTPEEKNIVNGMMVTNTITKPSVLNNNPVQEAEVAYVTLYTAFYGNNSYTNAERAKVTIDVLSVALTNTTWAARTDLFQTTFNIIETWWSSVKTQNEFHPYPWGQTVITNIVKKYPGTPDPVVPKNLKK